MKTPIYKKWWFWAIIAVVILAIIGGTIGNNGQKQMTILPA